MEERQVLTVYEVAIREERNGRRKIIRGVSRFIASFVSNVHINAYAHARREVTRVLTRFTFYGEYLRPMIVGLIFLGQSRPEVMAIRWKTMGAIGRGIRARLKE